MILALGYWVLGNICRYWVVLLLGVFFSLWHPIWYRSDSSRHHPHDNHLHICGAAVVSRCGMETGEWGGVESIITQVLTFYVEKCCIYLASKSIHCYATQ